MKQRDRTDFVRMKIEANHPLNEDIFRFYFEENKKSVVVAPRHHYSLLDWVHRSDKLSYWVHVGGDTRIT